MSRGSSRLYSLIAVALMVFTFTLTSAGDLFAAGASSARRGPDDVVVWVVSIIVGFIVGSIGLAIRHRFSRAILLGGLTCSTLGIGAASLVYGLWVEYTTAQVAGLIFMASGVALFAVAGVFATTQRTERGN